MELGLDRSSCSIVAQAESVGGSDVFQNQQLLETLSTKIRWFDLKSMEIFLRKLEEDFHKKARFPGFPIQPFWSDESLRKNPHQPHPMVNL